MKKILLTLLALSILTGVSAQTKKCGIDTKALVKEEIAQGATTVRMLAQVVPGYDRELLEKAGIVIGAEAGDVISLRVPVEALPLLESDGDVLYYSIAHTIGGMDCDKTRGDTRTDSVQRGLGVTDGLAFDGEGVYVGITDWGFDYTHPNIKSRIKRVWDHFRVAGPAPEGFDYGTVITGFNNVQNARGDTSNLYGYGTHGTHVAGIIAGAGTGSKYKGQAPGAKLLLCSFLLNEAAWMDGVAWMRDIAQGDGKRLVVNSSWGMYSFSTLDGTSLLSRAINNWADEGIVFCTSGGNNGHRSVPFHISKTFTSADNDTLRTVVVRASQIYSLTETGQVLIMWGEENHDFNVGIRVKGVGDTWATPIMSTLRDTVVYDTLRCGDRNVGYRAIIEHSNIYNSRPHIQIDIDSTSYETQLFIVADSGTVHAWNIANKENHAGNEGCSFVSRGHYGFSSGDIAYGVGEPACAAKCISVAAHNGDRWKTDSSAYITGDIADFSSHGPLINGVMKPEISAPGVDVVSSISYWTDDSYTPVAQVITPNPNRTYIWSKMSGTSMSSPATSGAMALILQANPALTVDELRDIVFSNARNDNFTGPLVARDSMSVVWGWGKLDALKCINEAIRRVSINQVETLRTPLKVFPNPATSSVYINTACGEMQTLEVYTIDGRRVLQQPIHTEATLDVSRWNNGVYILRVGSRTEKLVVR